MTNLILMTSMLVGGLAHAAELIPPKLPVLYYGTVSINGELATTSPIITMRRKSDNLEIASAAAGKTGRYFVEMPCADYLEQTFIFRIGDLITREAACADANTVPSVNLNLNFNSANQTVENNVSKITIPASIADSQETRIHFTATSTSAGQTVISLPNGLTLNRESAVADNNFLVNFAPGTVITGSSDWDGTLMAPTLSNVNLSIPADPSHRSEAEKIISIGYAGKSLTFDRPVSILFPGKTGKQTGFSRTGADFTEITKLCSENSANSLSAGIAAECKFNGPADLTIWTKHFTYFSVYRQVYSPAPPQTGGGGYIGKISLIKTATTTIASSTDASLVATSTPAVKSEIQPMITERIIAPQVLGVKYYADGALIRGRDRKIYLVEGGKLTVIRTVAQLNRFKGQKIYDVADEVIRQYLDFFDGQLIRGPDKKIYAIAQGMKKPINNPQELRLYAGQKINDVSQEILSKFFQYVPKFGVQYFADGSLIRGHDRKIYLIERGKLTVIRTLAQLNRFQGQKIYDAPDEVVRQYLPFFNGSLIRGSNKKIYIIKGKKQLLKTLAELKKYAGQTIHNVSDEILKRYI